MAKQGETVVRCERCGFLHGYLEACPKDLRPMTDWVTKRAGQIALVSLGKGFEQTAEAIAEALREAERRGDEQWGRAIRDACPDSAGYCSGCAALKTIQSGRATLAHNAERSRGGDSAVLNDARGLEQSCKPHRWLKVAAGTDGQERCSECGSSRTPVKSIMRRRRNDQRERIPHAAIADLHHTQVV